MVEWHMLEVSYMLALFGVEDEDIDAEIEKAVGKPADGGGAGYGGRDLTFWFTQKKSAKKAEQRVLKRLGTGITYTTKVFVVKEDE
jgi:hypothetical protein